MSFTTLTFVLFLSLVFPLYWALRVRALQNMLLLAASYAFYGWWDYRFCLLLLLTSVVDYGVALAMESTGSTRWRRCLLALSLAANLGTLGFFKYYNFFVDNLCIVCQQMGWHVDTRTLDVVLPVGISFYTFQTMSYTLDVYLRKMRATPRLVDFLAYVAFFPQLVAGPIERAIDLLPQFLEDRRFDYAEAADGCRQILWGFFKKLAIADPLGRLVDEVYGSLALVDGPRIALATVAFAFQIYCDFSAYSDIAIGCGRLFGFKLTRNFAYPYFAQSVGEFWRRWHISLSSWFRDYVYVPLGGSRRGAARLVGNLMLTFTISGLWHGASWNFIIWGAIMGLGTVPDLLRGARRRGGEVAGGEGRFPSLASLGRMAATFAIVCLGWVFFRAATLDDALLALRAMAASLAEPAKIAVAARSLGGAIEQDALLGMAFIIGVEWVQRRHAHPLVLPRLPRWQRWAVYTSLFWITLYVGPRSTSPFIYFQF
jgi:alginate O-acetyltransferase complex protein AlgI